MTSQNTSNQPLPNYQQTTTLQPRSQPLHPSSPSQMPVQQNVLTHIPQLPAQNISAQTPTPPAPLSPHNPPQSLRLGSTQPQPMDIQEPLEHVPTQQAQNPKLVENPPSKAHESVPLYKEVSAPKAQETKQMPVQTTKMIIEEAFSLPAAMPQNLQAEAEHNEEKEIKNENITENFAENTTLGGIPTSNLFPNSVSTVIYRPTVFNKSPIIQFLKVGVCHMCRNKGKLVYQCFKGYLPTTCEKKYCLDCLVLIYKEDIMDIIQRSDSWKCPFMKKICKCRSCCTLKKDFETVIDIEPNVPVFHYFKSKQKALIESNRLTLQPTSSMQSVGNVNGTSLPPLPLGHGQQRAISTISDGTQQGITQNELVIHQSASLMNPQDDVDDEDSFDETIKCMLKEKFKRLLEFNGQLLTKMHSNSHKLTEEEQRYYNKLTHSNIAVMKALCDNQMVNNCVVDQ